LIWSLAKFCVQRYKSRSPLTDFDMATTGGSPVSDDNQNCLLLAGFSTFYILNIVISNPSLSLVALPIHQTIRATGPAITVLLSFILYPHRIPHSRQTYCSIIPIILGAALATFNSGNNSATLALGVLLTLTGAFLAAF
jgi:drug/metabolite transporter (DMT)-like permease